MSSAPKGGDVASKGLQRGDIFFLLLHSISMESMSIAELIDCGVRQFITLLRKAKRKLTADEILSVINNVQQLLEDAGKLEILLQYKLESVLHIFNIDKTPSIDDRLHISSAAEWKDVKDVISTDTAKQKDNDGKDENNENTYAENVQYDQTCPSERPEQANEPGQQADQAEQTSAVEHDEKAGQPEQVSAVEPVEQTEHLEQVSAVEPEEQAEQPEQMSAVESVESGKLSEQIYSTDLDEETHESGEIASIEIDSSIDQAEHISASKHDEQAEQPEQTPYEDDSAVFSFRFGAIGLVTEYHDPMAGGKTVINSRISALNNSADYIWYSVTKGDAMYVFKALPESITLAYGAHGDSQLVAKGLGQVSLRVRSKVDSFCPGSFQLLINCKNDKNSIDSFSMDITAYKNHRLSHKSGTVRAQESRFTKI